MRAMQKIRIFVLISVFAATSALGQATKISPPKNKFQLSDDVQLGREAAAEVTKQLPLLSEDSEVDRYVKGVGQHLAQAIPPEYAHSEFHYNFRVANVSDINAFALPGGPMFVNRGMIEAAQSEAEMAGVMAHEISHVALRHGTAQASKAENPGLQVGAIGGAILGAIIGGNLGDVVAQGTQFGLGTYMMKFSREYETQADLLGSQIMARAGYDPRALASMFKTIEQQGSGGGPEWLSDHPNPGNRYDRISQEASRITISSNQRGGQERDFSAIQMALQRMPAAPKTADVKKNTPTASGGGTKYPDDARVGESVGPPSTRYRTYRQNGLFSVSVPDNWQQFEDSASVTFAPDGAYGNVQDQSVFTHGAMIGFVNPGSHDLAMVSDQYIAGILRENPYLKPQGKYKKTQLSGRNALMRRLAGKSPVTKQKEVVDVYTVISDRGQLLYVVQVRPAKYQSQFQNAFNQMVRSISLLD